MLADLRECRGTIRLSGDDRVRVAASVPPALLAEIRANKPAILARLRRRAEFERQYHTVIVLIFGLIGRGADADPDQCTLALSEHGRLLDEIGPHRAEEIRALVAMKWRGENGSCPLCAGPPHDERGGGA